MAGFKPDVEFHPDGLYGYECRRCREAPAVWFLVFNDSGMGGPIVSDRYCAACAVAEIAEAEAAGFI